MVQKGKFSASIGQGVQPWVRHGNNAGVRFNGAEGEVFGVDARFGQGIEERGLADVGKSDNTAFETHDQILC